MQIWNRACGTCACLIAAEPGAADALALAADGAMTVDAALVTLDFGLRHGLLADAAAAACIRQLRVPRR